MPWELNAAFGEKLQKLRCWSRLKGQFYQWHYGRLKPRLDLNLQPQGFRPIAWNGILAGLSPHATPCRCEGLPIWDSGFLILQSDRLCYLGEQTQFEMQRDRSNWFNVPASARNCDL